VSQPTDINRAVNATVTLVNYIAATDEFRLRESSVFNGIKAYQLDNVLHIYTSEEGTTINTDWTTVLRSVEYRFLQGKGRCESLMPYTRQFIFQVIDSWGLPSNSYNKWINITKGESVCLAPLSLLLIILSLVLVGVQIGEGNMFSFVQT
jgi:hypothetical protein